MVASPLGQDQNIALLPQVVATSDNPSGGSPNLVRDNDLNTYWSMINAGPHNITYDLNGLFNVTSVVVSALPGSVPAEYQIQTSPDGQSNWTTVLSHTSNIVPSDTGKVYLGAVRYLRLLFTSAPSTGVLLLGEFKVYGSAINLLGLSDSKPKSGGVLFPNPATGHITISGEPAQFTRFQITDLSGKLLSQGNVPADGEIPIHHLPAGTYAARLLNPGEGNSSKAYIFAVTK